MFHQIKTLIWRNFRLKKRSSISNFIEIGIPILIIIIIGFNSEYNDKIININEINNKKALSIDDINNLPGYQKVQFQFDFIFPNDYNLKDTFLLNFQNNELFKNFKILQKKENFSKFEIDFQNLYLDYGERVKINPNNITKFEPYSVNFYNNNQRNYEMKINVLNNEQELYSQYHAKINFFQYGIKFISPTEYTLYFGYSNELKDILKYNTEKSYILDYDYYDPIQTASIIQMCIDKAIIKTVSNKFNDVSIKVETKPMDQQKFSLEYSVNSMKSYIPFLMIVYFIPCICNLLNYLVMEKETKIKNSLIIIGLRKSNIWISWALVYSVIIIVSSILGSHFIYKFDIFLFIKQRIIICILIFFGLSCSSLSFIFSTFINNSKMGNIVSIFLSIFLFASYFLQQILENSSYWIKNLCYFTISPISFFSFFKSINHLEDQRQLVTFSTILEDPDLKLNFFGLISSFFIYFTLAIYLDNVLPQGSNLHRPWHFPITDLFRCCIINQFNSHKNINSFALLKEQNPYIEDDSAITKNATVRIENIQKTFKGKSDDFVLNEISFNAYKNEIFAILGHNGAGKSTLLNIMTGVLSASRGNIFYNNKGLFGNETSICKDFGYCPQFDTFNKLLTVEEHIKLFNGIKRSKEISQIDIDTILQEIGLYEKKISFPHELSGGQRRKLCIALAFIGDPKYVFLDEPTTGLDPFSRKTIWEFLVQKKENCTIFVTTHYMDEADFLADRKMIISKGKILCMGSSIFLKTKFNMNYTIDIQIKQIHNKKEILLDRLIENYCPGSTTTKNIQKNYFSNLNEIKNGSTYGKEKRKENEEDYYYIISYSLPIKYSKSFSALFTKLNQWIKEPYYSIKGFTLTAPTLEELFIKLQDKSENNLFLSSSNKEVNIPMEKNEYIDSKILINQFKKNHSYLKPSFLTQMHQIVKLRLKLFFRNKTFTFIYFLLPAFVVFSCFYFENKAMKSSTPMKIFKPLTITPQIYDNCEWFYDSNNNNNNNNNNSAEDKRNNSTNSLMKNIINKLAKEIENKNSKSLHSLNYEHELTISSNKLNSDLNYIGGFGVHSKDNVIVNENPEFASSFILYFNNTYSFSLPIAVNYLSNAILSEANVTPKISVTYQPFITTQYENWYIDDEKLINNYKEYNKSSIEPLNMIIISITLSLTLSIYGSLVVKEREFGMTHQLLLKGTKHITYWISILIGDFICTLIPVVLIFFGGLINNIDLFNFKYLPYTFGITILWIFGCLIFQYLSSSLFKNYEQASRLNVLLNPMISIGIGILIYTVFMSNNVEYVMNVGSTEELKPMNDNYKLYAVLLFYWPSFISVFYTELSTFIFKRRYSINSEELRQYISSKPVHDILNNSNMSYLEKSDLITKKFFNLKVPSFSDVLLLENKKFTKYILIMLIAIFLYTFILFLMEKGKIKKFKKHHKISSNKDETMKWLNDEPEDVQREYRSISYSINTNQNLKNKTKVKNKMDSLEKIDKNEQDTNPLLKIFRLKKYYTLNTKEMSRKRKKERKNNPKSHSVDQQQRNIKNITNIKYEKGKKIGSTTTNGNIKENKNNSVVTVSMNIQNQSNSSIFKTEFEKIDDRITYNGKKRKYTLKIINDVTFGVHRGECLSLLGPNGSGKTTLISIIVGLLHSSEGLVQFDEKNLNDHINHLFDLSIGYCGQHDSLWEELTVYETIQFYLYISGYPSNDINQMTEVLMTSAGIEIYKDKKINEISGGTKRKLSLIISICSFPDYLILDEPSAGMDPFTRRRIWKLITDLKALRQPSTILTTHSTEEAEALSDKMAVLVNGKLVCIDTPKNIKMKHNNMYILEVFTDHSEQFESLFINEKNIFGLRPEENYELESSLNHQKYFVKMRFENIANVFYWMEYSKDIGLVSQYNFGQYSLEQIFINFLYKK